MSKQVSLCCLQKAGALTALKKLLTHGEAAVVEQASQSEPICVEMESLLSLPMKVFVMQTLQVLQATVVARVIP